MAKRALLAYGLGLAGVALTVGLTYGAFALAGSDLRDPIGPTAPMLAPIQTPSREAGGGSADEDRVHDRHDDRAGAHQSGSGRSGTGHRGDGGGRGGSDDHTGSGSDGSGSDGSGSDGSGSGGSGPGSGSDQGSGSEGSGGGSGGGDSGGYGSDD